MTLTYEERLLKEDWHPAREGVDVKLLTDEGETYVLTRSQDRVHKERAMRRRLAPISIGYPTDKTVTSQSPPIPPEFKVA